MVISGIFGGLAKLLLRPLIGAGIVMVLLVGGRIWLHYHDKNIRLAERQAIMKALEEDAREKGEEVKKDVAEKRQVLENATPDELVEYFRTGRLPKRPANREGGVPKGAKPTAPAG